MRSYKYLDFKKGIRVAWLVIYDVLAIIISMTLALITRFDFSIARVENGYWDSCQEMMLVNVGVTIVVFIFTKLYQSLWAYASVQEMCNIVMATIFSSLLHVLECVLFEKHMPRSYYILYMFYLSAFIIASRFAYRSLRILRRNFDSSREEDTYIPTMIIGAGDSAYALMKDIKNSSRIKNKVVCVIDADITKIGKSILSVPIVGDDDAIMWAVKKFQVREIFIAIPHLSAKRKTAILEICKETGCKIRILPSMAQIVNGDIRVSRLRDVSIEDLLGREPVNSNLSEVSDYVKGRTILVTGGGGSIGSELCRQIAKLNPKQLIIFDIYENTTYDIQLELKEQFPDLNLKVLIGSVRDEEKVDQLFCQYRPDIVFHAAAHKHVPLMEDSPAEAVKNNVFGTLHVAKAADKYGAKKMVLISTDKAVNPTNVMGASKRICEMIIQAMARESKTTSYVAVRFGNVLGSHGSVIPIFKRQIAAGGPVTVTDPNIIRYFMTIPEAVSLVMQAGAYATGGEIFILDMGQPVRIDDMARNLIKLSGFEPDVDIKIQYTGLRPGEKLFEECLKEEEGLQKTENELIFIANPLDFDEEQFYKKLDDLKQDAMDGVEDIKDKVQEIVPSYHRKEMA